MGNFVTASGEDAVLSSPTGHATVLQDAGGQGDSSALAINDKGQSVGWSETAGGGAEAVLWSPPDGRRAWAQYWGPCGLTLRP